MKRISRLSLAFVALGALLAAVVVWGGFDARGADAVMLDVAVPTDAGLRIVWAGDTMLADSVEPVAAERGYPWVLSEVAPLLDGDVVIINHEAPITGLSEPYTPNKLYTYAVEPSTTPVLKGAGVTVLGLANNHAMDMGPDGLAETMDNAADAGFVSFGAGLDGTQAERPLIISGGGVTVGVVALAKGYGARVTAGRDRAGTVVLSEATIARGYALARKAGADYVVAFVHWGENYEREILDDQRRLADDFAEAGYDLVIGHGPHVAQGAEVVRQTPVFYSLGNFVFGTDGSFSEENPGYGLVLSTEFSAEGLAAVSASVINTDNKQTGFQPHPYDVAEASAILESLGVTHVAGQVAGRQSQ